MRATAQGWLEMLKISFLIRRSNNVTANMSASDVNNAAVVTVVTVNVVTVEDIEQTTPATHERKHG